MSEAAPMWRFRSQESSIIKHTTILLATWEVEYDPISDDYTPGEIDASDLFDIWRKKVGQKYPNGLVPITWHVESAEAGVFEYMPFQFKHYEGIPDEDFLTFFTWPLNTETGDPLSWLSLPVLDKRWNKRHANKGGLIQEHTGWKPSILQPYVYLPVLTKTLRQ